LPRAIDASNKAPDVDVDADGGGNGGTAVGDTDGGTVGMIDVDAFAYTYVE
jgi:hypothetical protein